MAEKRVAEASGFCLLCFRRAYAAWRLPVPWVQELGDGLYHLLRRLASTAFIVGRDLSSRLLDVDIAIV